MTIDYDSGWVELKCPPHVWVRIYPRDEDGSVIPGRFFACDECREPGYSASAEDLERMRRAFLNWTLYEASA